MEAIHSTLTFSIEIDRLRDISIEICLNVMSWHDYQNLGQVRYTDVIISEERDGFST
jgi:hypothetical protein